MTLFSVPSDRLCGLLFLCFFCASGSGLETDVDVTFQNFNFLSALLIFVPHPSELNATQMSNAEILKATGTVHIATVSEVPHRWEGYGDLRDLEILLHVISETYASSYFPWLLPRNCLMSIWNRVVRNESGS
jgi:hypothetical protein